MIVTISREFGSGGRELGKRLADALGVPCYDREIISIIAKEHGFDENYVSSLSEKRVQAAYPFTIGNRFSAHTDYETNQVIKVAVEQKKVIENFAKQGDCVIVGRCADIILREYRPFNIFVYADEASKLARCAEYAEAGSDMSEKEMRRRMREIDKNRSVNRGFFADSKWGAKENYHLCVNTSGKEIKKLVPAIAEYVRQWFA